MQRNQWKDRLFKAVHWWWTWKYAYDMLKSMVYGKAAKDFLNDWIGKCNPCPSSRFDHTSSFLLKFVCLELLRDSEFSPLHSIRRPKADSNPKSSKHSMLYVIDKKGQLSTGTFRGFALTHKGQSLIGTELEDCKENWKITTTKASRPTLIRIVCQKVNENGTYRMIYPDVDQNWPIWKEAGAVLYNSISG